MLSYLAMCFKLLQCLTLEHQQVELQHRFLQTYLLNLVPDTHVLNKVALSCRILNVFILTISRDSKAPTLMIVGRRELSGSIFSNCSSICCGTCICTNHMFFIFFAWWLGNGESFGTLKSTRKFIKELVPEVISGMTSQGHCSIICPSTKVARDTPVEVSPGQAGEKLATCLSIVPRNTNAGAGARAHRFNLNSNTSYPSYGSGRNIEISEPVHYRFSEGFIPMDVHWVRMIQTTFQLSVRSFQPFCKAVFPYSSHIISHILQPCFLLYPGLVGLVLRLLLGRGSRPWRRRGSSRRSGGCCGWCRHRTGRCCRGSPSPHRPDPRNGSHMVPHPQNESSHPIKEASVSNAQLEWAVGTPQPQGQSPAKARSLATCKGDPASLYKVFLREMKKPQHMYYIIIYI